ncbi:MAG TPA: hypothetical protein VJ976_06145 [Ornithinimicrobium sp.]|uniref:hypothetical protein n=1 Tax=Ornithinimicrobium sp. TaxID=1977084 RepID=UPI002B48E90B|nr:hypothetical protein [Ornithinimicrobium sp.]HKJ11955.1 hypothetical protein [Ornithinimicrobium sp.]
MSQMTATARVQAYPRPSRGRGSAAPARPPLRVVHAAPAAVGHLWYAVALGGLIIGGLLLMLMLNMARAEGSFVLSDLREEHAALHAEQVTLETEVADLSSPSTLAEKAEDLGMVASPSTAILRLSDHSLVGVAAMVANGKTHTVDLPGARSADEVQSAGE